MVSHLQSFWVLKISGKIETQIQQNIKDKREERKLGNDQRERERETNRALNSDHDGEIASYIDDFGQTHVGKIGAKGEGLRTTGFQKIWRGKLLVDWNSDQFVPRVFYWKKRKERGSCGGGVEV